MNCTTMGTNGKAWKTIGGTRNYGREKRLSNAGLQSRIHDTPEQIRTCLSCTKEKCSNLNCPLIGAPRKVRGKARTVAFGKKIATYEYQGKNCTAAQLAELAGVTTETMRARLKSGWTVEDAVRGVRTVEHGGRVKTYGYKGGRYTLRELSQMAGISVSALNSRIKAGWTVEDAVERQSPYTMYEYQGRRVTANELGAILGMHPSTIRSRRAHGWTDEEIARTPKRPYEGGETG